jgi:predicted transposase YdaD
MGLDDEDLNAARIMHEMSRTPLDERVDRLELSMLQLFGNENIYHRMEDIEARIRRLERIADATEQRVYELEKRGSIYVNVPVFTETNDTILQSYTLGASSA